MSDAPLRVFISYARADSTAFVDRLERDLKAQHFVPWVDRHGLEGGQEWMEIIQQAIDECHALAVVLSPAAVQSRFVRIEYRYADEIGKLVIPLRYLPTPTTPMDLRILQWVDFQTSYDEGLRHLVQSLSHIKPPAAQPPTEQPQQPPPAPVIPPKTKKQWRDEGNAHYDAKR